MIQSVDHQASTWLHTNASFFFFFLLLTEHYSVPSRELLAAGTPSTSVTARKHCRETLTTEQISSRNKQDFTAEETFIT